MQNSGNCIKDRQREQVSERNRRGDGEIDK